MATKIEDEVIVGVSIDAFKLARGHRGLWRLSGGHDKPAATEALQKANEGARKAALEREDAAKREEGR